MASIQLHFILLLLSFSGACLAQQREESMPRIIDPLDLDPHMNDLDADMSHLKWDEKSPQATGLTDDERKHIEEHLSVAENETTIEFEGSKFRIHDKLAATWEEAEEMCSTSIPSGHLAVLNNMNVVNFISKTLIYLKIENDLWVGGKSNGSSWLWAPTNETIPLWFDHGKYPPWMYVPGSRDQGCVLLTPAFFPCTACYARFMENECHKKHQFICQTDYNVGFQGLFPPENTTVSSVEEELPPPSPSPSPSNKRAWIQMAINIVNRAKVIIQAAWSRLRIWFPGH
ncbi:uncharacterized protein LOC124156072 [Ischnura elegans]|uniref:uncharacterized protein LOC124156072 n=1 Tax=Ischnura elegans TaxID=197161 RepID=UPI001ED8A938|nr:uncharacterized protein LOC124156072 [Ischnura elegans]